MLPVRRRSSSWCQCHRSEPTKRSRRVWCVNWRRSFPASTWSSLPRWGDGMCVCYGGALCVAEVGDYVVFTVCCLAYSVGGVAG